MKKLLAITICLALLVLCACGEAAPEAITEATETWPDVVTFATEARPPLSEQEQKYLELYGELPPGRGPDMSFSYLFYDPFLARYVAGLFGKSPTDITTYDELNSYTGKFDPPEWVESYDGVFYLNGAIDLQTQIYLEYFREFPPESEDSMAFCNLFPDPFFAKEVAGVFEKNVTDTTTYEELASYTGAIGGGPGGLKSVEGIGLLTGVTIFSNGKNDLEELPPEIGKLTELTEIDLLKSYSFRKLPEEIGKLKKLKVLDMALTWLEALPAGIGGCVNLEILRLSNTSISSLPSEIGKLKKLKSLNLHSTGITQVPDSICELESLVHLSISHTGLKALPKDMGKLQNLETLDLFGCPIKRLPVSMKQLKNLRYLNVYDCFNLHWEYETWFPEEVWRCGVTVAETTAN